ncbi:unnamed protein product [Urochloa decumbens]|uniref:Myb/SANT-like domain-containing protein n=1 Tax=Urochloa decumbens TaxID=240449 RepID=A0ABC9GU63_9POAL
MDGAPFDFFSQTESSGAAVDAMDGEGWGLTPPRLRRDSSSGRVPRAGNVTAPGIDLNADSAAASYPDMTMYTHILQRDSSSDQGARGKAVVVPGRVAARQQAPGSSRQPHVPSIQVDDDAGIEEDEDEDENALNQHSKRPKSKANWTDENTYILCELACEEIEDGNFTAKVWNTEGYKNMKEKYYQKTKLWHPGREVKNKIQNLKGLYNDWVWLQQQTGCGRGEHGEVTATKAWWEREIKSRPNLKKFRKGNPEYIGLLHEMFHEVAVDGTSAFVPGIGNDIETNDDDDDEDGSPMSNNTRKSRTNSADFRSTATSPSKKLKSGNRGTMPDADNSPPTNGKTKGPFLRTFKEITTRMDKEAETSNTILQAIVDEGKEKAKRSEERKVAVATCQQLAIECGATEESIEYFVACDLFKDKHNRFVFQNMKTPQARLIWLKRWCKAKKMYDEE